MFKIRSILLLFLATLLLAACAPSTTPPSAVEATAEATIEATVETPTATPAPPTIAPTETAAPPDPTAAPTETAADPLNLFVEQLQTAVIDANYTDIQTYLSNPFLVAGWRSKGRIYEPAEAIAQFQTNTLPAPTSVQFTNLDTEQLTALLGQPPAALIGPGANIVATLHSTGWGETGTDEAILFVTEENNSYSWSAFIYTLGSFTAANLNSVAPPIGLIYRPVDQGLFQIDVTGAGRLLLDLETANQTNLQISPDGQFAAYYTDNASKLWLLNIASGETEQLAADYLLSTFMLWANNETLFVGIFLDPNEADGPNNGHISTVDINTGAVQILDETRLSGGRPALSPDGQTVGFDVYAPTFTAQLYDPTNGLRPFDPTLFNAEDESQFIRSTLFNPAWSTDGQSIAWLTSTGEWSALQVYDLASQTAVQLLDWDPARFGGMLPSPVWSLNGQWIALEVLANGEEGSGLWLIATTGNETRLVSATGGTPHWANDELLVLNTADGPHLYDVNSDALLKLDIPAESTFITLTTQP